jgi:TolB-like protein/DNA-binding winged helix-turn-helix (wHTH) protein
MDASANDRGAYVFGPFRLDPTHRALWRGGTRLKVAGRLFETLLYFVENPERIIEKDELIAAIWPGRIVEESNLTQAISALRKVLHVEGAPAPMIATISGRGYRLAVAVRRDNGVPPAQSIALPIAAATSAGVGARPWHQSVSLRCAAVALVLAAGAFVAWRRIHHPAAVRTLPPPADFAPPPLSVAVLPFANIGGTPAQTYLSDGLSDEVILSLGQIDQLRVAARTSSFTFRKGNVAAGDIARRLNVATVLEGSIRWDGPHMRITATLIDGRTGFQLWSHGYDRDQGDVLHLQTDIATAISKALQLTLGAADIARMDSFGTNNAQALDAYLHGTMLKQSVNPDATKQTLADFDQALALDPNFVMAHVQRARVLSNMAQGGLTPSTDVTAELKLGQQAIAESERAVALAPGFGPAHDVLGVSAQWIWDFKRAGAELARARALSPNDPAILRHDLTFESFMGRGAGLIEDARRIAQLDPLSPQAYVSLYYSLLWADQYEEAGAAIRHAEQAGLNKKMVSYFKGIVALKRADFGLAAASCAAAPDWRRDFCLAIAYHALGRQQDADQALADFRKLYGDNGAVLYAAIYAQWGRTGDALDSLELGYRLHDVGLVGMQVDPFLNPVRHEPRFQALVQQMRFLH